MKHRALPIQDWYQSQDTSDTRRRQHKPIIRAPINPNKLALRRATSEFGLSIVQSITNTKDKVQIPQGVVLFFNCLRRGTFLNLIHVTAVGHRSVERWYFENVRTFHGRDRRDICVPFWLLGLSLLFRYVHENNALRARRIEAHGWTSLGLSAWKPTAAIRGLHKGSLTSSVHFLIKNGGPADNKFSLPLKKVWAVVRGVR